VQGFSYLIIKTHADMRRYTPQNQLSFESFKTPFERKLDPANKWVRLANEIPWDDCATIYLRSLDEKVGRPCLDARLAVGSLLIKHLKGLSDRDVVEELSENVYLQYFVGFSSFNPDPAFDASLFVILRKRMGVSEFDEMNDLIISKALGLKHKEKGEEEDKPKNKGKLKLDATVTDQMIVYPTDLGLLNRSREELERLIDLLHQSNNSQEKPRTYRRIARQRYLAVAMKKRKHKKVIRKAIGQQLNYIKRDIKIINTFWDERGSHSSPFNFRDLKLLWVIQHVYKQQRKMYEHKTKSHPNRIVNIYQPYVRAIPRGKDKTAVEFGAKLGVSEFEGFSRLDHLSWEAYHEGKNDLVNQVQRYRKLKGYYPDVVLCDGIYLSRENRKWLKGKNIRHIGKPLGRPKEISPYARRKLKKERGMRNHIEGKFGQGKNKYELDRIRARRQDTSQSWIAAIILVLNLVRWNKILAVLVFVIYQWAFIFSTFMKLLSKRLHQMSAWVKHRIHLKNIFQSILETHMT